MSRHRDTTSLDELFTIISDIISTIEACEVSTQFQSIHPSSVMKQQQPSNNRNHNPSTFSGPTITTNESNVGKVNCIFCTKPSYPHTLSRCDNDMSVQ